MLNLETTHDLKKKMNTKMKHDVLISGCMTNSRKLVMLLLYFLKIFLYPNAVLDVSQIFV